ncbi:MAG TPA: exodeoxyribonuclease III [Rhizobiaceae bacterium]|nr:exodeoxyribonuclease III [Rhizobiaceae bacterium]
MDFSIATWNINSVRLRLGLVTGFLQRFSPDVLCLQETKCPNELFPHDDFRALGYGHVEFHGQKGYNGVATISKLPLTGRSSRDFCSVGDTRHLETVVHVNGRPLRIHNIYVPAGGDEPDRTINPKFGHKLDFLDEMATMRADLGDGHATLLVGDLNIAPLENDVWSHKQLLKVVSHTPVETEGLERLREGGGWLDLMRQHVPPTEKLYTWWSYRGRDWSASDRGRRLDHVWGSRDLGPRLRDITVLREARGWDQPSDHVPVIARFDFS